MAYFPNDPITRKLRVRPMHDDGTDHDGVVWESKGALARMQTAYEKFSATVADINRRTSEGELGPVGRERALKAPVKEYTAWSKRKTATRSPRRPSRPRSERELTTRPRRESKSADQAVETAFRRHRPIQRFEAFDRSGRNEVINRAREVGDFDISKPCIMSPAYSRRDCPPRADGLDAQCESQTFEQLQEIQGAFDYSGKAIRSLAFHERPDRSRRRRHANAQCARVFSSCAQINVRVGVGFRPDHRSDRAVRGREDHRADPPARRHRRRSEAANLSAAIRSPLAGKTAVQTTYPNVISHVAELLYSKQLRATGCRLVIDHTSVGRPLF